MNQCKKANRQDIKIIKYIYFLQFNIKLFQLLLLSLSTLFVMLSFAVESSFFDLSELWPGEIPFVESSMELLFLHEPISNIPSMKFFSVGSNKTSAPKLFSFMGPSPPIFSVVVLQFVCIVLFEVNFSTFVSVHMMENFVGFSHYPIAAVVVPPSFFTLIELNGISHD